MVDRNLLHTSGKSCQRLPGTEWVGMDRTSDRLLDGKKLKLIPRASGYENLSVVYISHSHIMNKVKPSSYILCGV